MFVHSSQCVKLLSTKGTDGATEMKGFGLVDFDVLKIPFSSVHTLGTLQPILGLGLKSFSLVFSKHLDGIYKPGYHFDLAFNLERARTENL